MARRFGQYVEEKPRRFGSWTEENPFPGFHNPIKTDNQRRSLWEHLVDKGEQPYTKSTDPQPYYDVDRDAYVLPFPKEYSDLVPWDTVDQWFRLKEMRDAFGPSCHIKRERNAHLDGVKISQDRYHFLRDDICRRSQAIRAASEMGWKLKSEQLAFLTKKEG